MFDFEWAAKKPGLVLRGYGLPVGTDHALNARQTIEELSTPNVDFKRFRKVSNQFPDLQIVTTSPCSTLTAALSQQDSVARAQGQLGRMTLRLAGSPRSWPAVVVVQSSSRLSGAFYGPASTAYSVEMTLTLAILGQGTGSGSGQIGSLG
jgi:hypothetical protein